MSNALSGDFVDDAQMEKFGEQSARPQNRKGDARRVEAKTLRSFSAVLIHPEHPLCAKPFAAFAVETARMLVLVDVEILACRGRWRAGRAESVSKQWRRHIVAPSLVVTLPREGYSMATWVASSLSVQRPSGSLFADQPKRLVM
jgi:hypothetical protein